MTLTTLNSQASTPPNDTAAHGTPGTIFTRAVTNAKSAPGT